MKKSKFLAVVAFLAAVASVFAFTPPPTTAFGKHSTLGAISGTLVENDCDQTAGTQCRVKVGSGINEQIVPAYTDQPGAASSDPLKRVWRPAM